MKFNTLEEMLKSKQELTEETAQDKFSQIEPKDKNGLSITELLDHCSEEASDFYSILQSQVKRGIVPVTAAETNKYNPIFIGPTGAGKTSIIRTWARDNGYEIITLNMMGDALDFLGVKTIDKDYTLYANDEDQEGKKVSRVSTVATKAFDPFLRGSKKVLFLDEINKTNPAILASLFDLISFHTVQNGDELMYLPKLLFTVGAMNPTEYGSGREPLDAALKARMIIYTVGYDVPKFKTYMINRLNSQIKAVEAELEDLKDDQESPEYKNWAKIYNKLNGRKDLVEKILENTAKFQFTDAQSIQDLDETEQAMVPRTFESAIDNCDGTAVSLIKWTKIMCGLNGAQKVTNLLWNYIDKQHKANDIWSKDYSVKDGDKKLSAEEKVLAASSEDDKKAGNLETNLLDKLKKAI